jgi:hypothetical protein
MKEFDAWRRLRAAADRDFERPIDLHVGRTHQRSLLWVLPHARGRGIEMTWTDGWALKQVPDEALEEQRLRGGRDRPGAEAEVERAQWVGIRLERERVKRESRIKSFRCRRHCCWVVIALVIMVSALGFLGAQWAAIAHEAEADD